MERVCGRKYAWIEINSRIVLGGGLAQEIESAFGRTVSLERDHS